jgi:integrase
LPKPSAKPPGRVVRKRLADGTIKTYRYGAWQQPAPPASGDTVRALLRAYEASPEWAALAPKTKTQYLIYLRPWLAVADADPKDITRRDILAARDEIATTRGVGAAAAFGRVTGMLFGWAVDREWVPYNPAAKLRAMPSGHLPAWSEAQIRIALAGLPEPFRRVVVLALHTGQRRGDLCAMTWAAFDGSCIRLRQGKTGRQMTIPAHPDLCAELAAWRAERVDSVLILQSPRTAGWTGEHLSREMGRELVELGLPKGLNIHGLRKAAARRLAEAGCSALEIAAITGHASLSMVQLYTASADQARLAQAAVTRLQIQPSDKRQKSE